MSASQRRFYTHQEITPHSPYSLEGAEHQHLAKVLRARAGEQVTLFNGMGAEFTATVVSVNRASTELLVGEELTAADRELPFQLSLAAALPKGDRQQWLVEKLVELGVTRLLPLETEHGVAQPGDKTAQRIERWIIAASKQCGRNRLMKITPPTTLENLFSQFPADATYVAHPEGALTMDAVRSNIQGQRQDPLLVIGPEGGFSDREVELARSHACSIVSLGPRILRIETAAIAMACGVIFARE